MTCPQSSNWPLGTHQDICWLGFWHMWQIEIKLVGMKFWRVHLRIPTKHSFLKIQVLYSNQILNHTYGSNIWFLIETQTHTRGTIIHSLLTFWTLEPKTWALKIMIGVHHVVVLPLDGYTHNYLSFQLHFHNVTLRIMVCKTYKPLFITQLSSSLCDVHVIMF